MYDNVYYLYIFDDTQSGRKALGHFQSSENAANVDAYSVRYQ